MLKEKLKVICNFHLVGGGGGGGGSGVVGDIKGMNNYFLEQNIVRSVLVYVYIVLEYKKKPQ